MLLQSYLELAVLDTLQTVVSDEDLQLLVSELKLQFPDAGECMLSGFIRARGIHVSRDKLRCAIHAVDPINTALQWNAKIQRRTYSVPGPSFLWHIGITLCFLMTDFI